MNALGSYANTMNTQYFFQGRSELYMLVMTPYGRYTKTQSLGHLPQLIPNGNAHISSSVGVNMLRKYHDTLRQGISSASPITARKHGFNPKLSKPKLWFWNGKF